MALNKLCLNNKETLILHKKIGYYKFCSSKQNDPEKYYDSKKVPAQNVVPSRKQFNLQKILFYCTFPEEEEEKTNAIETGKDKNIRSQSTIEASVMVTVSNSLLPT